MTETQTWTLLLLSSTCLSGTRDRPSLCSVTVMGCFLMRRNEERLHINLRFSESSVPASICFFFTRHHELPVLWSAGLLPSDPSAVGWYRMARSARSTLPTLLALPTQSGELACYPAQRIDPYDLAGPTHSTRLAKPSNHPTRLAKPSNHPTRLAKPSNHPTRLAKPSNSATSSTQPTHPTSATQSANPTSAAKPTHPTQPSSSAEPTCPTNLASSVPPAWHGNPGQPGWPGQTPAGGAPQPWPPAPVTAPVVVPFNMNFPRGIYDKLMLTIRGQIKPDAKMFTINFLRGNDIALHINPRFNEGGKAILVRNHKLGERWGKEERELLGPFPFVPGHHFEMKILCTFTEFKVVVNNTPTFEFKHRIREVNQIDRINILHDVTLTSVNVDTLP
ncbi:unnamed protein product [Leuciscus chuanchicus]